jgi:chromosome segregation ATPase
VSDRTNSIPKALKDAIKLRKEIDRTRHLRATCSQTKHSTEEQIRELEQERIEAYTRAARGDHKGKPDAAEIDKEINAARRGIETADAEIQGTLRAEQQAEEELSELLIRELPTFIEAAEQETQQFIEAYEEVEPLYREAFAAWQRAAEAWAPLRAAIFQMRKLQTEQAGFYMPDVELAHTSAVGNWPYPQPDELFPMPHVPRPHAFEPQDEPDELEPDDEEDE